MRIFDIDGPLIQFLTKMADLMWLNILTLICCIPIFTIGASLTALQYMALKIVRDEEGYITKGFFKAFKENFRQSTIIWLMFMAVGIILFADYRIITTTDVQIAGFVKTLIMVFGAATVFTFMFVFPLQGKFSNTVRMTIWNAFVFSVVQFPKTILMILLYALPYVLTYLWNAAFPVAFVFCLSLPAFLSAKVYNKFFLGMEEQILGKMKAARDAETLRNGESEEAEPDERIFKNEIEDQPETNIELGQNNQ